MSTSSTIKKGSLTPEACKEMGCAIYQIPSHDFWVPLAEVHKFLGEGWSRRTVLSRITSGELIEKKHWRDERPLDSAKPKRKINVFAVNRWLSER